jgi:ABC-type amino acid transport system permease subunit
LAGLTVAAKSHRIRRWSWRSRVLRALLYQIIAVAVLVLFAWFLAGNTL